MLHERAPDELVAALFSGPWCTTAAKAFYSTITTAAVGSSCTGPFGAAIAAVDDRWRSLSEEDQQDQGWAGTASGVALHVGAVACTCTWLGDNQVFHLRNRAIVDSLAPHTLYQNLKENGHQNIDRKLARVQTRWMAPEHTPDSVSWALQANDVVLVCSSGIDDLRIPALIQSSTRDALAEELLKAAQSEYPRSSHSILVIAIHEEITRK